ncbi:hypothetical protein D9756_005742 [Leucocoprinus leucothites]|uniref:Tricalbin n=1 Tax=Leucocoprinus leucothites TaxID=201217 RepID=A0A8H5D738_9AGAR|nr:hypothetical protein D9756_005742 [Leucoagaricus leucothites]
MATNGGEWPPNLAKLNVTENCVPVHTSGAKFFLEEKAAAAGRARDQPQIVISNDEGVSGKELKVNNRHSKAVPTISAEDHGKVKPNAPTKVAPRSLVGIEQDSVTRQVPGSMPAGSVAAIPEWYRVGWHQISRTDDMHEDEDDSRQSMLEAYLDEKLYGDWYHNAAVIAFAVFTSHFLTRFGLGWGWVLILLAFCSTYYSVSVTCTRRRARDDIQRQLVKSHLASEHETADWINNFLNRFWLNYEPVLSATVVSSVDQILSTNTPAFLDSIRLTTFTLGTKAPRIDNVRTFPKTDDDVVMMDWAISFTPSDTSEVTQHQNGHNVNPKITLSIRAGKGPAMTTIPIILENITFSSLMRVRLKLMTNFPHVQVVDMSFIEQPVIDYVLKPIGGEKYGFDIANIPGLSSFIRSMMHSTLESVVYEPNVFTLNLEQLLSGKPLDAAIGVLQVTVHSASGIKATKIGGGVPDPFVSLSINERAELARTKCKRNTYHPTWTETKFLLVNSIGENLTLNLWDFNDHTKNTLLGTATFDMNRLGVDTSYEGIVSPLLRDGKVHGELRYDVEYYPVLEQPEGSTEVPESSVGIVRLVIHQAKDLDQSKSLSGSLNPIAKVFLGNDTDNEVFSTPCFKHTISPVWEAPYEFLCPDKDSCVITTKVIDDHDFLKDPVIGYTSVKLVDLLSCMGEAGRDWFPLSGATTGRVRITAEWKPVAMAGSLHGLNQYRFPIGVVRLNLVRATDVKNVEALHGGKSDPYVQVISGDSVKGRTEVVNNNLNPVWDQIIYVPVNSLKEAFRLECMDYQHLTRDRSLGSVELRVSDLAEESNDPKYPYRSTGVKSANDTLRLDNGEGYKGTLTYTAQFVPALALRDLTFSKESQSPAAPDRVPLSRTSSRSSSRSGCQAAPQGVTIKVTDHGNERVSSIPDGLPVIGPVADAPSNVVPNGEGNGVAPTDGEPEEGTSFEKKHNAERGVEMSIEDTLTQQSGIVVFNIISGNLAKKARLEVLLDDGYWPCFSTHKSTSTNAHWGYVGEGFIKEIDFSQIWFKLNEADEGTREDIVGEWKGDAKDFLKKAIAAPQTITLTRDQDHRTSTILVEARYIPVPIKLEERETVSNMGILRVDLLNGDEIRGVDRSGKSDPYAVFTLNGQKVFKSQVKKSTLAPEWNEDFSCIVPSRVTADFTVEVFDWNQFEQAKHLGEARIDLTDLEPMASTERTLPLVHPKHGAHGHVRVRLLFHPQILAKARQKTSTLSNVERALTQTVTHIGGLPVSAATGVFQGVTGIFKHGDKRDDDVLLVPDLPAGQSSHPVGTPASMGNQSEPYPQHGQDLSTGSYISSQPGTLRVTVLEAKDISSHSTKAYVTLRISGKEYKTKHVHKTATPVWNESFIFSASTTTTKIYTCVRDHKTLGKDKELGSGEVDIWRHIQPHGVSSADVSLELRHGGLMKLRLEFDPTVHPRRSSSISTGEHVRKSMSFIAPSRFSIRSRRPGTEGDDD